MNAAPSQSLINLLLESGVPSTEEAAELTTNLNGGSWVSQVLDSGKVDEQRFLGGGSEISVLGAIAMTEQIAGRKAKIKRIDRQKGDVRHTRARLDEVKQKLGYAPNFDLAAGLAAEWQWVRSLNI